MKLCTDIEQSKKLIEILPVESADMTWIEEEWGEPIVGKIIKSPDEDYTFIPCWSLAALLQIMPQYVEDRYWLVLGRIDAVSDDGWFVCYEDYIDEIDFDKYYVSNSNLLDACYEIILKLKEKDLL